MFNFLLAASLRKNDGMSVFVSRKDAKFTKAQTLAVFLAFLCDFA
jgi:hypothetical protein